MASVRTQAWTVESNSNDLEETPQLDQLLLPFQPLVGCLRFLGVQLDPCKQNESSAKCNYSFSIGLLFLLLNGLCHIYSFIWGRKRDTASSVMSWNVIIDYLNYSVLTVGVHASLFVVSRQHKWKLLWENFRQILKHHQDLNRCIYRVTNVGIIVICSECLILVILPLPLFEFDEAHQILDVLLTSFVNLLPIFAHFGWLLFVVMGWTVALGFRSLGQQLLTSALLISRPETSQQHLISMMADWKRLHILLCDTTHGLGDCFGPILLIWVTHIFVSFISTSFYIVGGFHSSSSILMAHNIFLVVRLSFHLLIITAVCSRICDEATQNGKILQQVDMGDSCHLLQEQVDMLTTEVFLSVPRITAMEYVDLDLSLIPTLIGTTLTYLIVLCQFQS